MPRPFCFTSLASSPKPYCLFHLCSINGGSERESWISLLIYNVVMADDCQEYLVFGALRTAYPLISISKMGAAL